MNKLDNILDELNDLITEFAYEMYCKKYKIIMCSATIGLKRMIDMKLNEIVKECNYDYQR